MKTLRIATLCLLILAMSSIIFEAIAARKKQFKLKEKVCFFQYIRYEYNPAHFAKFDWRIQADNRTMDYEFTLKQSYYDNLWCEFNALFFNRRTSSWETFYAMDVNVCSMLSPAWTRKFNILNVWLLNIIKYGNVSLSCPVRAGSYSFLNMRAEKVSMAPLWGQYRIDSLFYIRYENKSIDVLSNNSFAVDIRMK